MNVFDEFSVKGLQLKNRIVMPPMCLYSVVEKDGYVTDFHIHHYIERAIGGAGLIIIEMTGIEPDGRITDLDLGLWEDGQIAGIKKIVDSCHQYGAKVAIQIGHAGRKAQNALCPVSSSAIAYDEDSKVPKELTKDEIDGLIEKFGQSVRRAVQAGVDAVELHGAHGYLIHQFQSRYTNHRNDEYGKNLGLFGTEVVTRIKKEMPKDMPLIMRISAVEYVKGGYGLKESLLFSEMYKTAGVDVFHISSGGEGPLSDSERPGNHAGYQVPLARAFKNKFNIPVIAVGKLEIPQIADAVLANEDADLIAVGRGMLRNPYWALEAGIVLHHNTEVPKQYERAFPKIQ